MGTSNPALDCVGIAGKGAYLFTPVASSRREPCLRLPIAHPVDD